MRAACSQVTQHFFVRRASQDWVASRECCGESFTMMSARQQILMYDRHASQRHSPSTHEAARSSKRKYPLLRSKSEVLCQTAAHACDKDDRAPREWNQYRWPDVIAPRRQQKGWLRRRSWRETTACRRGSSVFEDAVSTPYESRHKISHLRYIANSSDVYENM
jgi:sarcosine oxidase delta subunit